MNKQYHWLTLLYALALIATLAVLPSPAMAQDGISLSVLDIRVWPEYDRPSALVFYIGEVTEGTTLPVELRFRMPPGATLNAAAYLDDQTNSLLTAGSRVEGDTAIVSSPNGSFHVEFYDPGLKVEGDRRTYSLVWQGDYPVELLLWEVEQPFGASDMNVEPAGGSWSSDINNLQVYSITQSGLQAGQSATLSVSYTKTDDTLTADALVAASPGVSIQAPSAPAGNIWQIVGLIGLIVILPIAIAGTVYAFRRRRRGQRAAAGAATGGASKRFCTRCGHAAGPEDRFCRQCGAQLG